MLRLILLVVKSKSEERSVKSVDNVERQRQKRLVCRGTFYDSLEIRESVKSE